MSVLHVAILIPARNEEVLLPRCLESVLRACAALPEGIGTDVIVAVDSSTDRTLAVAQSLLQNRGVAVTTNAGCVGAARILAAEVALQRYSGATENLWFANTDADCFVPPDWLLRQLHIAGSGVGAIAGIVDVDTFEEHQQSVESRFRKSYVLNADGTHGHVHGANLGFRADAYLNAGGWQGLETAEDHDLWRRLLDSGASRASSTSISVITSGRRQGRAPLGFAGALAAHNLLEEGVDSAR